MLGVGSWHQGILGDMPYIGPIPKTKNYHSGSPAYPGFWE